MIAGKILAPGLTVLCFYLDSDAGQIFFVFVYCMLQALAMGIMCKSLSTIHKLSKGNDNLASLTMLLVSYCFFTLANFVYLAAWKINNTPIGALWSNLLESVFALGSMFIMQYLFCQMAKSPCSTNDRVSFKYSMGNSVGRTSALSLSTNSVD